MLLIRVFPPRAGGQGYVVGTFRSVDEAIKLGAIPNGYHWEIA
jgi:hypothetical protein